MHKKYIYSPLFVLVLFFIYRVHTAETEPYPTKGRNETVASVRKLYGNHVKERLKDELTACGLNNFPKAIRLVAIKEDKNLEVYTRINKKWKLFKRYPFTGYSGRLGPKLQQGDYQIPEGVYRITWLNANSAYHLSAKVNYPNSFDKAMAKKDKRTRLGGDIFIHGKNVTIGCIPIGDKAIEELFVLMSYARNTGIQIIITPRDFRKGKEAPEIAHISWENQLYNKIKEALKSVPIEQ